MPEAARFLGTNSVVEAATVLLGPDDGSFQINISDLSFSFHFLHDGQQPAIQTEQIGRQTMRVSLNTYQTPSPTFKVKVGFIWGTDLFLESVGWAKARSAVPTRSFSEASG
jgi:hypothetical protein